MNKSKKFLISLMSLLLSATSYGESYHIDHLEPLSWWTNMASDKLQLMVHGKDIAKLSPRFNNSAIEITDVRPGDSNNYLFIDLRLKKSLTPGDYSLDFYQQKTKVLSTRYRFNARNQAIAADHSFSPKDVIYLITPDRFANGDLTNDNHKMLSENANRKAKGGRHGGDIQGIINHLDYISGMGFTQIWTNPMVENNQPNHSYHGYAATDFYQIDARFGSNQLYRELSQKARSKGIGLIKDVVLNHIGSKHWWMTDLPMKDWLNFQETLNKPQDFTGTHHKRESLHDPYATEHDKTQFSDGWFVPSMPDLNQRNPFVSTYLIQNTLWWIEYANLTGLRVDTYSYSDRKFLTDWTQAVTREYPNINIVGEEWTTNPAIVSYWQRGKTNLDGYQSYLPSLMDFPLQQALVQALTQDDNWNTGLNQLYQSLANDFLYADPYRLVTFADNHDMSRIFTQVNEDLALYKMAMSILLTTRGIPQIFYGTEIAMANPGTDDHGIIRSDFPGGWSTDTSNVFSETNLSAQQTEVLNFTKTLLNWRKSATAVHQGKLVHYAPNKGVYVYGRLLSHEDSAKDVLVVVNKNQQEILLDSNDYPEIIGKNNHAIEVLNQQHYKLTDNIKIKANSAMIFELTKK